ncbi:hypothetical protein CEXT_588961 [Caerostris extrusa]|uniref:Uncharacterized protein n=1 Tax=Caerostris extrusa TaxID=172846 RepID=A0AAV4TQV6_CAEEX|nr:hypothetical protein CEXT_588961 [Caerostris extrusa]
MIEGDIAVWNDLKKEHDKVERISFFCFLLERLFVPGIVRRSYRRRKLLAEIVWPGRGQGGEVASLLEHSSSRELTQGLKLSNSEVVQSA